jgi:hypothetical protein
MPRKTILGYKMSSVGLGKGAPQNLAAKHLPVLLYFVYVLFALWNGYINPTHSWDTLPYTAIILSLEDDDLTSIHDRAYELVKLHVPLKLFTEYTSKSRYRQLMATDPVAFAKQFPFYSIKPLYVGVGYVIHRFGFSIPNALIVVSLLSVAGIALILFAWLGRYFQEPYRSLFSALIFTGTSAIFFAGLVKPDPLSAVILLSAMYFLIERNGRIAFIVLTLMSIAVRPDNIIFVGISYTALALLPPRKLTLIQYVSLATVALITYFGIQRMAGGYGWVTTMGYFSGGGAENHPENVAGTMTLIGYWKIRYWDFRASFAALEFSYFAIFIFLATITLLHARNLQGQHRMYRNVAAAAVLAMIARYLLWPQLEIRFYVPYYIPIATLALLLLHFALCTARGASVASSKGEDES